MNPSDFTWHPDDHTWTRDSHVARFMRSRGINSIAELRQASVRCHQWFWDEALRDMGLEWTCRYTQVRDDSRGFCGTRWFVGGQINVTHNCVDRHVRDGHGAETALFYESDALSIGGTRRITFAELAELVNRCAAALRATGVQRGDNVALCAPLNVANVVVLFATMKIGARFAPISWELGEEALRDQLALVEPKIVFASRAVNRRGILINTAVVAEAAAAGVASISRVVWTDDADWTDFLQSGVCIVPQRDPLALSPRPAVECEVTEAEEPCLILFTGGPTGETHATVHTHAGCLAQMGKEIRYGFDARAGEPFCWITDHDGMMGPWEIIGGLLYRTPIVLLDGTPDFPTSDRVWEICDRLQVVTLGCSRAVIQSLMQREGRGPRGYDLSRLRVLGSTGEQSEESSHWYFAEVGGSRCPVMNISPGAEILGSYLQSYPLDLLKRGAVGGPALGLEIELFTEKGQPASRSAAAQLVCKQPAPSMTKSLLQADARYLETYFQRFAGVWTSGQRALVADDGQWFSLGDPPAELRCAEHRAALDDVAPIAHLQPA